MKLLEITNLSVNIGNTPVLKDINLELEEGETLAVLGSGGSGKSTLLKVLKGYDEYEIVSGDLCYHVSVCSACGELAAPSSQRCQRCGGEMQRETLRYTTHKNSPLWRRLGEKIAYMQQRGFAGYHFDTALDNIITSLKAAGVQEGLEEQAMELLDAVGLRHRALQTGFQLSGGEKQRLSIAFQLARKPLLFLADDPLGSMDDDTAETIAKTLQQVQKTYNLTLILTGSQVHRLEKLAEKAVILERGSTREIGSIRELSQALMPRIQVRRGAVRKGRSIIKVQGVSKTFYSVSKGLVKALDNVSFEVFEGEILGIVGPSGSGKTTLARLIAGVGANAAYAELYSPVKQASLNYEGDILVRDPQSNRWVNMKYPGQRRDVMGKIQMLYQEYTLNPHRNILYNLTGTEEPTMQQRREAIEALRLAGFSDEEAEELLEKNMYQLSESQRHRCALARVLVKKPAIVILDEPSESMDAKTKAQVAESLHRIREETGTTFIIISHDQPFTEALCDRILYLNKGRILQTKILSPLPTPLRIKKGTS